MASNRFEALARQRKVDSLVLTAVARKVTAEEVANDDHTRTMLLTNTPDVTTASLTTWSLVVQRLADLAKMAAEAKTVDVEALATFLESLQ